MVIIDIVVKSVVLLERSSELAISSGESSQDEEYVLIKTGFRKFEKKCVTGFNDTNSSQMQLFKFESCSQKSTWYIDPNALCKYLSTCE